MIPSMAPMASTRSGGGDGGDWLYGGGAGDSLYGDDGVDCVDGGAGNDTMYGGNHADVMVGMEGCDTMYGEDGNDYMDGGFGDDNLNTGPGIDLAYGGSGRDVVDGVTDTDPSEGCNPPMMMGGSPEIQAEKGVIAFHDQRIDILFLEMLGTKEGVELSPATMESGPCSEMTTEAIVAMDADPDMTEPTTSLRVLPAMNGHAVDGKATPRRLRVLLTMAHYYRPGENGSYGSLRDKRAARLSAVRAAIAGWRQLFSAKQYVPSLARPEERVANQDLQLDLEVVVCTHGDDHLLDELDLPAGSWRCARRGSHPMELGYECQAVLREQLGRYDYYCYQEDDLILHDPLWFQKLAWFRQLAGDECLLQPHRYEISTGQGFRKAYIDGDLPLDKTLPHQDIGDRWQLSFDVLGQGIRFIRPKNPHAGCYFLTARQFEQWSRQPYFLDRERSFYSHLESAATLGIMRTFRVYKPAPDHAGFFEIEHAGSAWTERLGRLNATAKRLAVSPR